jgi:hypothetical protein
MACQQSPRRREAHDSRPDNHHLILAHGSRLTGHRPTWHLPEQVSTTTQP